MLRTSNPVLKSKSFGGFASQVEAPASDVRQQTMTIRGTVDKTAILLALVMVAGLWPWKLMQVDPAAALSWLWIGLVGGLVTALIIIFKNEWAGPLAPLYAACEGLVLGALSAFMERRFPGIVFQAVAVEAVHSAAGWQIEAFEPHVEVTHLRRLAPRLHDRCGRWIHDRPASTR